MISSFLLVASVWLGVVLAKILPQKKSYNQFLLTFSGAFLLSISILEIFPTLFQKNYSENISFIILLGVLFQILLELVTKGIEHGHTHSQDKKNFYVLFFGLMLHSFLEGMPIGEIKKLNQTSYQLLSAIFIHNIPIGIIFYNLVKNIFEKQATRFLYILLFSLAAPLGSLIGSGWFSQYNNFLLAFISGTFLHISTLILFESSKNHQYNFRIFLAIMLGVGIAIFNSFYL